MGQETAIQWTSHTFNGWIGCTKISPGCTHCYAEVDNPARISRGQGLELWGPKANRRLTGGEVWGMPLRWNRKAEKEGRQHRVFCASQSDVFEGWGGQMVDCRGTPLWRGCEAPVQAYFASREPPPHTVPYTMDDARRRLFALIERTPHLTWQLLTKRPENMTRMAPPGWASGWPANVWAMTSVENQDYAQRRIPELLKVPCRVRGLSVEPLLGPVDLAAVKMGCAWNALSCACSAPCEHEKIAWVIIGGESGPHARPCHLEWVRSLVQQCQAAGVACFVKQMGAMPVQGEALQVLSGGEGLSLGYASVLLRDPKGGDPEEWPADLRLRQFPA